jgi:hypothetical protein
MEDLSALGGLLRALRGALSVLETENVDRISLHNALRYAEQTQQRPEMDSPKRAALLRRSASYLRQADSLGRNTVESEVLAATRWAMTAALFETPDRLRRCNGPLQ